MNTWPQKITHDYYVIIMLIDQYSHFDSTMT